jgi:hypothetical protein
VRTAQTAQAGRRSRPQGRAALTGEQQAILDASATGETVAICAGAGTGKTATLRMIAAAKPNSRMLYVAYNRAVRIDAEATFPQNVTCKTAHALAYRRFGAPIADRLSGPRLTARQNAQALSITQPFGLDATTIFEPASLATMAPHTVARFCRSADRHITASHFVPPEGLDASQSEALAAQVLPQAQRAWDDLSRGPKGRLKLNAGPNGDGLDDRPRSAYLRGDPSRNRHRGYWPRPRNRRLRAVPGTDEPRQGRAHRHRGRPPGRDRFEDRRQDGRAGPSSSASATGWSLSRASASSTLAKSASLTNTGC